MNGMQPDFGMIHGRFQPFHIGHSAYASKAAALCKHLIVGITNPDPWQTHPEESSAHRHTRDSNPFTYFERLLMVRAALLELGLPEARISIVPFPIHDSGKWRFYTPTGVNHYVRVFSEWEQSKVDRLVSEGYRVDVLDPGEKKEVAGTEVRRRILAGEDWHNLVPASVWPVIESVLSTRGLRSMDV